MIYDNGRLGDLLNSLSSKRQLQKRALFEAAQAGREGDVTRYCTMHKHCKHLADDRSELLEKMIREPQDFVHKQRVFNALTDRGFDFQSFFLERPSITFGTIVGSYKADPKPETKDVAAVLGAEYLRTKLLLDMKYKIDMTDMFRDIEDAKGTLRASVEQASVRDSVIAVQHALVDYVEKEAQGLPLNRGAAMLKFLASDIAEQGNQSTVDFWTYKITNFREGSRYHTLLGDVKYITPLFDIR